VLILPPAVGNVSVAYKITIYNFYSVNNFKQAQRMAALFTQQKKATEYILQFLFTSFLFDVSQFFYTPDIILLL
jgi:hypothetical protein